MIRSGKVKDNPSSHIQNRAAKMRAEIHQIYNDFEDVLQIRVEPDEKDKAVRIVEFKRVPGDIEIRCWDAESLVACDGNRHARYCSHVHRAYGLLMDMHGRKHLSTNESDS